MNDFSTEATWDTFVVKGNNYSGSHGPVGVMADGQIFVLWLSDVSTIHKGWPICADAASALGDPHVSSITGDSFGLWRTGRSTICPSCWSEVMSDRTEVHHVHLHFAAGTHQWKFSSLQWKVRT